MYAGKLVELGPKAELLADAQASLHRDVAGGDPQDRAAPSRQAAASPRVSRPISPTFLRLRVCAALQVCDGSLQDAGAGLRNVGAGAFVSCHLAESLDLAGHLGTRSRSCDGPGCHSAVARHKAFGPWHVCGWTKASCRYARPLNTSWPTCFGSFRARSGPSSDSGLCGVLNRDRRVADARPGDGHAITAFSGHLHPQRLRPLRRGRAWGAGRPHGRPDRALLSYRRGSRSCCRAGSCW